MQLYKDFVAYMHKLADISAAISLMNWDQEVYLPKDAAPIRSQQIATLSGLYHDIFTQNSFGELLSQLLDNKESLSDTEYKNVVLTKEDYDKSIKFDTSFVIQMSQAIAEAYHAWIQARADKSYATFEPSLSKLIELQKQKAEIMGYENHPYNALLQDYEPGASVEQLDKVFSNAKEKLKLLIATIKQATPTSNEVLKQFYPKDKQWSVGLDILKTMGYDFNRGRQDISTHPFSTSFAPTDCRVTTRIDEYDLGNMIWSCIHEGGHALYEQGLPMEQYGLPLGSAISLAIHESQSRMWENNVGRSLGFWQTNYPSLQATFPEQLALVPVQEFYKAMNKVAPNFVRTEADELHYHLHVLIRYEIEKDLISGTISTKELEQVWNAKYMEYLGVEVTDPVKGILQDIHWSHGSVGYFPTYSLGSFYAAQFFTKACKDIPTLKEEIAAGNSSNLLAWLRTNVHAFGRYYTAEELCEKVTGEKLNFDYFYQYAIEKYTQVYAIKQPVTL